LKYFEYATFINVFNNLLSFKELVNKRIVFSDHILRCLFEKCFFNFYFKWSIHCAKPTVDIVNCLKMHFNEVKSIYIANLHCVGLLSFSYKNKHKISFAITRIFQLLKYKICLILKNLI